METSKHLHLMPSPRVLIGKGLGGAAETLPHPSLLLPGDWDVSWKLLGRRGPWSPVE